MTEPVRPPASRDRLVVPGRMVLARKLWRSPSVWPTSCAVTSMSHCVMTHLLRDFGVQAARLEHRHAECRLLDMSGVIGRTGCVCSNLGATWAVPSRPAHRADQFRHDGATDRMIPSVMLMSAS